MPDWEKALPTRARSTDPLLNQSKDNALHVGLSPLHETTGSRIIFPLRVRNCEYHITVSGCTFTKVSRVIPLNPHENKSGHLSRDIYADAGPDIDADGTVAHRKDRHAHTHNTTGRHTERRTGTETGNRQNMEHVWPKPSQIVM